MLGHFADNPLTREEERQVSEYLLNLMTEDPEDYASLMEERRMTQENLEGREDDLAQRRQRVQARRDADRARAERTPEEMARRLALDRQRLLGNMMEEPHPFVLQLDEFYHELSGAHLGVEARMFLNEMAHMNFEALPQDRLEMWLRRVDRTFPMYPQMRAAIRNLPNLRRRLESMPRGDQLAIIRDEEQRGQQQPRAFPNFTVPTPRAARAEASRAPPVRPAHTLNVFNAPYGGLTEWEREFYDGAVIRMESPSQRHSLVKELVDGDFETTNPDLWSRLMEIPGLEDMVNVYKREKELQDKQDDNFFEEEEG
jgi:hypothetical protein